MKPTHKESIIKATGVAIILIIFFSIVESWIYIFAESDLFGKKGAYSHEDRLEVAQHIYVSIFSYISSFIKIIIPCVVASLSAPQDKIK